MVDLIAENTKTSTYSEAFDRRYQSIAKEIKNLKERNLDAFLRNNAHELPGFDNDLIRKLVKRVEILSINNNLSLEFV